MPEIAFHFDEDHPGLVSSGRAVRQVFTALLALEGTAHSDVHQGSLLFENVVAIRKKLARGGVGEWYPADRLAQVYSSWLAPENGLWTTYISEGFTRRTWALLFKSLSLEMAAAINGRLVTDCPGYVGVLEIRPDMPFYCVYGDYLPRAFTIEGRTLGIMGSP